MVNSQNLVLKFNITNNMYTFTEIFKKLTKNFQIRLKMYSCDYFYFLMSFWKSS